MTVTELRKELEQLETDGRGASPVVIEVNLDGDPEWVETSTVRAVTADPGQAPDFGKGQILVLVE